jgi:5'-nucleotidase
MRILICNDDGIYSPGILALAEEAAAFGDVRIVAPDEEQSSMGQAITSSRPLRYRKTKIGGFEAYRVNGTPSDCAALGIHNWEKVHVVLSGINLGYNVGNSMWHSGTLAAAKQAALLGVQSIALSAQPVESIEEYAVIRPFVREVLALLLGSPPPAMLVNVNFPPKPNGIKWAKQSVRHYDGRVVPSRDPYGDPIYWFTAMPVEGKDPESDRSAVEAGCVSLTPLRLDLTDEVALARLRAIKPTEESAAAARKDVDRMGEQPVSKEGNDAPRSL